MPFLGKSRQVIFLANKNLSLSYCKSFSLFSRSGVHERVLTNFKAPVSWVNKLHLHFLGIPIRHKSPSQPLGPESRNALRPTRLLQTDMHSFPIVCDIFTWTNQHLAIV